MDTFDVEPVHRVHSTQEVLQQNPWQPYYTIIVVISDAELDVKNNVIKANATQHILQTQIFTCASVLPSWMVALTFVLTVSSASGVVSLRLPWVLLQPGSAKIHWLYRVVQRARQHE